MDEIERLDDFVVFCYGGYEKAFLTRMRKKTERKDLVDRVLKAQVNVLSLVYSHLYFPTYSNGLKDVARCLGFSWSEEEASGIQSIAWRMRWESTHDDSGSGNSRLTTWRIAWHSRGSRSSSRPSVPGRVRGRVSPRRGRTARRSLWCMRSTRLAEHQEVGKDRFVHPEFNFINDCAYFDYQRERVFVRTSKTLRKRKKVKKGVTSTTGPSENRKII